ncbi:MAG TPA: response regulator [Chthoniobacteraceae bacterium]
MMPSSTPATSGHRPRALIVDDEPSVREVLSLFFTEEGYDVGEATDGDVGLETFRNGAWDVVFTDRMMPRMSGDLLAAEIRKIAPNMPIVLVTAYADMLPDVNSNGSCFDMVVRKPFTRETLRAALSSVRLQTRSTDQRAPSAMAKALRARGA